MIRKFLMTMFANEISSAGVGRARERDAGINQTEFGGHQYDAIGNGYSTRVEGQHITVCARGEPGGQCDRQAVALRVALYDPVLAHAGCALRDIDCVVRDAAHNGDCALPA